ncbi:MAG: AsmA family protein, partial [Paludibacteraceae bacterium]|nr:AsmA family protein [Paludibacteraceae bacterium]
MAVIVLSIPLIITLLLSNRSIQNYVVDKAASAASEFLGTEVSIGNIEYRMPASISLNDVYLADLEADTLAYVGSLSARLSISALAQKRISIHNVEIDRAKFYLKTDTTGLTNLQFIIDALQDTTQTEAPALTFDAPGVMLKNCRIRVDNTSFAPHNNGLFDPMHIDLRDINIFASLNYAAQDSVNIVLNEFSFREKSGLTVSQMGFRTVMGNNRIALEDFKLRLIESEVNIPVAEILLDSLSQVANPSLLASKAKARFN